MSHRTRCHYCATPTSSSSGYCQGCKSKNHHAAKRIKKEGLLLDTAGGSWWVWDARGEVLIGGRDTKREAFLALAHDEEMFA